MLDQAIFFSELEQPSMVSLTAWQTDGLNLEISDGGNRETGVGL